MWVLPSQAAWSSSKCHQEGVWTYSPSLPSGTLYAKLIPMLRRSHKSWRSPKKRASVSHHALVSEVRVSLWSQIICDLLSEALPNCLPWEELTHSYLSAPQHFVNNSTFQLLFYIFFFFLHTGYVSLPNTWRPRAYFLCVIFSIVCAYSTCSINAC